MKSATIWMNKTTSSNWNRPVVGIVRVEKEISICLKKLYPQGIFKECVWDGEKFIEHHEKITSTSDENIPHPTIANKVKTKKSVVKDMFQPISKRQAIVNISQGFFLSPPKIRPLINSILYAIKPRVISLIGWLHKRQQEKVINKHINSKIDNNITKNNEHQRTSIFKEGDVFISMGLDWDYPFFRDFYNMRTEQGVRVITCCYDLIPVLYPQYCVANVAGLFGSYFMELADGSDEIICISQQTQKDLVSFLDNTGSRMVNTSVFELGDNVPQVGDLVSDDICSLLNKDYILFVSSIERRKNHEVIYRAYHQLCKSGKRDELPVVVFVGMHGWGVNELLKDIELDPLTKGMFIQLNHVNDAELAALYKSAMFCVFPSLYEGWGLPVGEALSLGKIVLCSDRGSLPEVAKDLAVYLDPWSPHIWADAIYKLSTDIDYRNKIESNISKNYNKRTWTNAGLQVKNVIDKYIETKK